MFSSPDFDVASTVVWSATDDGIESGRLGRTQATWNGEVVLYDVHTTDPDGNGVYMFEMSLYSQTDDSAVRRTYTTRIDFRVNLLNTGFNLHTTLPDEREALGGGRDEWLEIGGNPFGVGVSFGVGGADDAYMLPGGDTDRGWGGYGHVRWRGEGTPDTYARAHFVIVVDADACPSDPSDGAFDWDFDVESRRSRTRILTDEDPATDE